QVDRPVVAQAGRRGDVVHRDHRGVRGHLVGRIRHLQGDGVAAVVRVRVARGQCAGGVGTAVPEVPVVGQCPDPARGGAGERDARRLVGRLVHAGVGRRGPVDGDDGGVVGEPAVLVLDPGLDRLAAGGGEGGGRGGGGDVGHVPGAVVVEVEAVLEPGRLVRGRHIGLPGEGDRDRAV